MSRAGAIPGVDLSRLNARSRGLAVVDGLARFVVWGGLGFFFLSLWLWSSGALFYSALPFAAGRRILAVVFLIGFPVALALRPRRLRTLGGLMACGALVLVAWSTIRPSNDRAWSLDQKILPTATIEGDRVAVRAIRNFSYRSESDYEAAYYDAEFDLNELETVWFGVEPFGEFEGAAHTFLSFGFKGDRYVAVSVEIRKEAGEEFTVMGGLFKQYELMYVIGDERDLIGLRANIRRDPVYLFPAKSDATGRRKLFLSVMKRANALAERPEFYNTLFNNCTTAIARHVNELIRKPIPWGLGIVFPGYSGELAYRLDLLDTELPFDQASRRFLINERAARHADSPDFSVRIREAE